jgi:hypothetical protein
VFRFFITKLVVSIPVLTVEYWWGEWTQVTTDQSWGKEGIPLRVFGTLGRDGKLAHTESELHYISPAGLCMAGAFFLLLLLRHFGCRVFIG